MKSSDLILLGAAALLLYLLWQHEQTQGRQLVPGAGQVPTGIPVPPNPVALKPSPGLTVTQATAVRASGQSYRAPTATGQQAGVAFGQQAVDRSKPRPAETAYKSRTTSSSSTSATSRALNNSALNKAEQYSIAGGVATAKAFGIPPALSRPIAKYGNPIALGKDVVSGGKAVVNFFGGLF
jgi:hypothetical protein